MASEFLFVIPSKIPGEKAKTFGFPLEFQVELMLYAFLIGKVEEFPWNNLIFILFWWKKKQMASESFFYFTGAALETVQVPVQGHSVDSLSGKQFLILL